MTVPVTMTEGTFLSLAASMALRQLSRYGVPGGELETLRNAVQDVVEDSQSFVRKIANDETRILRDIPEEEGEDRAAAEFVLMLSVYAELGCRIADKVYKKRLAETN